MTPNTVVWTAFVVLGLGGILTLVLIATLLAHEAPTPAGY